MFKNRFVKSQKTYIPFQIDLLKIKMFPKIFISFRKKNYHKPLVNKKIPQTENLVRGVQDAAESDEGRQGTLGGAVQQGGVRAKGGFPKSRQRARIQPRDGSEF